MSKDSWGYVRVSQESDASLEEQKDSIRQYARDRDLDLLTTRNEGTKTSGFNDEREEYQLIRQKINDCEIDAVITRDRARMSRDFDDRLSLIQDFRKTGVEWHVVESGGPLGLDDVQTAGVECLHAMMDDVKKRVEIERSRKVVEDRLAKGYDHGATRYGMVYREDGKYQRPGEGWDDVERIFELADAGDSPYEIGKKTGVNRSTVENVIDNREWYEERYEMHENNE